MNAPDGPTLLELEREVRQHGSAIKGAELQGCWILQGAWPKGKTTQSPLSNRVLRGLKARLELATTTNGSELAICNAINLGPLVLRFQGNAELLGRRPLLMFQFNALEITLWGRRVLQRSLPSPAPQRRPFFALIARDPSGWLAARGRGGGLALWTLAQPG